MKKFIMIIMSVCIIFFICLSGYLFVKTNSQGTDIVENKEILVEIPNGSSSTKIAQILKESNLIKNEKVFKLNVKKSDRASELKAGKYKFKTSMDNETIINLIADGKVFHEGTKVVIPEGELSTNIVNDLVIKRFGTRTEFVKLFRNPSEFYNEYPFLKECKAQTLEGFLYPATYYFKEGTTPKEIFSKMIGEFEVNYKNALNKTNVKNQKLSMYEIVTLASIIEKESIKSVDRPIVSSVFYNRLEAKMPLQTDAVLQYVLPNRKAKVLYSDLEKKSPYNLYLNKGLPPTPIASPSYEALTAAMKPDSTEYLYFIGTEDGTNVYAKTYEEHKENIKKHLKDHDLTKAEKAKEEEKKN